MLKSIPPISNRFEQNISENISPVFQSKSTPDWDFEVIDKTQEQVKIGRFIITKQSSNEKDKKIEIEEQDKKIQDLTNKFELMKFEVDEIKEQIKKLTFLVQKMLKE